MPNWLLQYDITHIIGLAVSILGLVFSGILIRKYSKLYHNVEIFWIAWWLVITLIMGVKFI